MPLTATIAPSREQRAPRPRSGRVARRAGTGAPPARRRSRTRGPQSGQALGWAWKRRSRGSSYSARQARAHLEPRHRRLRAVVGDAADDREPRPAVGAVGERVAVAAVARGRRARPGSRRRSPRRARPRRRARRVVADSTDPEAALADRARRGVDVDRLDRGQRRRLGAQPGEEAARPRSARPRPRAATPRSSLSTQPPRPSSLGEPEDEGRKPTPCTVPVTRTPTRRRPRSAVASRAVAHRGSSISSRSTW